MKTPPYFAVMPWGAHWAVVALSRRGHEVVAEAQAFAFYDARDAAEAVAARWNQDWQRVREGQP